MYYLYTYIISSFSLFQLLAYFTDYFKLLFVNYDFFIPLIRFLFFVCFLGGLLIACLFHCFFRYSFACYFLYRFSIISSSCSGGSVRHRSLMCDLFLYILYFDFIIFGVFFCLNKILITIIVLQHIIFDLPYFQNHFKKLCNSKFF